MISVCGGQAIKQLPTSRYLCFKCLKEPVWPLTAFPEGHRSSVNHVSLCPSYRDILDNLGYLRKHLGPYFRHLNFTLEVHSWAECPSFHCSQCNQWGLENYFGAWSRDVYSGVNWTSPVAPLRVLTSPLLRTSIGPDIASSHVDTCITDTLI